MKTPKVFWLLCASFLILGCKTTQTPATERIETEIHQILEEQVTAWNRGDVEGFMQGYVQSDSLRFASAGNVSYGWQTLLQRYKTGYPDKATMGTLTFDGLATDVLCEDAALVFGKWQVQRQHDAPWGYFSLLFRKTGHGWRIVHDHTSSAQ